MMKVKLSLVVAPKLWTYSTQRIKDGRCVCVLRLQPRFND